jgi:hypothetical protein
LTLFGAGDQGFARCFGLWISGDGFGGIAADVAYLVCFVSGLLFDMIGI